MLVEQLPDLSIDLVDLRDMNILAIADVSTYLTIPTSDQLALQITPPGYNTVNVPFTPLSVNIYKCVDLGLTCSDSGCTPLPDGIYDIRLTVISSGTSTANAVAVSNTITRQFLKIDQMKCAYEHAYLAIKMECVCHNHSQDRYMEELDRAKLYITGCIAEANRANNPLSFKYYEKAEFILNNLACKFAGKCSGTKGFFSGCGCNK